MNELIGIKLSTGGSGHVIQAREKEAVVVPSDAPHTASPAVNSPADTEDQSNGE